MATKRKTATRNESKVKVTRKSKLLESAPKRNKKPAAIVQIPTPEPTVIKGSVVPSERKTKANKAGVWRSDKLDDAVRSAFLREGSENVTPNEAARIATDNVLEENGQERGRWGGKNAGMLSMNLRNVLRGIIRNDGQAVVYGKKITQ